MYLQRLAIHGFKSFANKVALEFKPGIIAIVGPNGSGKSNTADAVRWVLGEQSLKSLRGKKSGDVIFAGSDKKTRLGYCQVDMHLNNEDRKAPIEYDEVVISRKVYRDGEGEYFINKHQVRLQDIILLLAKSNFGQRSYSIIGQGMVDLFLSATPSQRKEYFDEAAGVRQFQIKKEQAEHKLALTKENLLQAELLIQEIEPRLRSLTRQVNRLEKREEILHELRDIQHRYYAGLWHELHHKHGELDAQHRSAEQQRLELVETVARTEQQVGELAKGDSRQELFQSLQREYGELVNEKNKLLREQAVIKGTMEVERQQRGEHDLVWLERRKEQLQHELQSLQRNLDGFQISIKKSNEELTKQEASLQSIREQAKQVEQEFNQAKQQLSHKKVVTVPELHREVEALYGRQRDLLTKIESAVSPEDLQSIKTIARGVADSLSTLVHKLRDADAGDPRAMIALQDRLTELARTKEEAVGAVNRTTINLRVEQEKLAIGQKRLTELRDELEKTDRELNRASADRTPDQVASDMAKQQATVSEKLQAIDRKLSATNEKLTGFNVAEQAKKEKIFELQAAFSKQQAELSEQTNAVNTIQVELAKIETKQEDLEKEMVDELNEEERKKIFDLERAPAAEAELFGEIQKLKHQLELIGGIDPQVAQEYQQTKERYDFLTKQSADLNKAMADLEQGIINLEATIKQQFDRAFEQINTQFTLYFKILFNGGNAHLGLVKEEVGVPDEEEQAFAEEGEEHDEDEEAKPKTESIHKKGEKVVTGIDIHATPPGKKLRGISMLSGGERALTAIALICAIIHHNPSPFVILDEVDAALDESNSIRFASIIERLSHKTQFIVITHNRATMNKARVMYGVTMGDDGVSKLLSVNMEEAEKVITKS